METETVARYCGVHILDNPFSIDGAFHYFVPPYMAEAVTRGTFVTVPFGRGNRKQVGVVVSEGDESTLPKGLFPDKVKPIDGVSSRKLSLSDKQLDLCFYLKETTLCTLGEAIRSVMPASALTSLADYYTALPADGADEGKRASLSAPDLLVLEYIRGRHTASGQSVKTRFGAKAAASLERLCGKGFIARELTVREPEVPTVTYYSLARPLTEIEASLR
jgi:primosomal protein N'